MAVSLKVPVKKLEALEADDLSQLPDAVFARALAATVCRSLKIDPEPVLARMPQLQVPPLHVGSQETPVRLDSHGDGLRRRSLGGLPRPVVYLSALLLIGAMAVALMPAWRIGGEPAAVQATDGVLVRPVPNQLEPSAALLAGSAEPAPAPQATAAATAATPGPAAPAAADAGAAAATPVQAPSAAPVAAADRKSEPASAAPGGAIAVFSTREASWVQVVDAAGLVHLRKTLGRGETVSINGTLPLSVVIGRANAIDLVVRGKPFDVQAVAKDNVARFQIQ
jgi:cytoskeleton protein RodZ